MVNKGSFDWAVARWQNGDQELGLSFGAGQLYQALDIVLRRYQDLKGKAEKMVSAFDKADEKGLMSDHGDGEYETSELLEKCAGCRLDVASEDLRDVLEFR